AEDGEARRGADVARLVDDFAVAHEPDVRERELRRGDGEAAEERGLEARALDHARGERVEAARGAKDAALVEQAAERGAAAGSFRERAHAVAFDSASVAAAT